MCRPVMIDGVIMVLDAPRPDPLAALQGGGYRVTAPRKAIAGLLERKQEGFSAEALSNELPGVGRATVYRTVKLLLEVGVVCKLATVNGSRRYSLCGVGHHHHHKVCVQCGAVEEFGTDAVERLIREISVDIPGEVVSHLLELYVNCGSCPATGG